MYIHRYYDMRIYIMQRLSHTKFVSLEDEKSARTLGVLMSLSRKNVLM